jgi:hypothetical protein
MRTIATAVAAIALLASGAAAQGNGKGGDHGNGRSAGAAHDGDSTRGNSGHAEAPGQRAGGKDHGNGRAHPGDAGAASRHANAAARTDNRGLGRAGRGDGWADRGPNAARGAVPIEGRGRDEAARWRGFSAIPARAVVSGCPPGLAKKNPPCVPPGQARGPIRYDRPEFWGLRLGDGRWRYDGGYLVQLAPDGRVGGYIPLLGGALGVGSLWPASYEPVALPHYYESYYGLGPDDSYRYADNVIYQIDPGTAAITSVIALLTGDDFTVGRPMPPGYDVYNVPYAYRAQYADTPEAWYRYSDGYVYEVDPETRLIAAAIGLLAS